VVDLTIVDLAVAVAVAVLAGLDVEEKGMFPVRRERQRVCDGDEEESGGLGSTEMRGLEMASVGLISCVSGRRFWSLRLRRSKENRRC
jgi:hypothetical protein